MPNLSITSLSSRIVPILQRNHIQRASLFGSFARGESSANSDLDMVVEYGAGTTLLKAVKLKMELEKELGCRVDLVSPEDLHPRIKDQVLDDLVTIL